MNIHNRFEVPMPPAEAWSLLMNLPSTVPCFPGAELTEALDGDNYKGRVKVKLGPVSMIFNGKLVIEERDEIAQSGAVRATWAESKGRGNAVTVTRFTMRADGGGTQVDVDTEVQLAGQVAQYGRGVGVISDISSQLVSKFADNLRTMIEARQDPNGEPGAAANAHQSEVSGLNVLGRALINRLKSGS
jgi:carbon monoxide dehydrogenase subunit G